MRIGTLLKNSGPASTREIITGCAAAAEQAGIDDVWVLDHIAIPPDESEGSGGRYVDPLATLAYLAGITERVNIGVSVLILPYRPALATAKWVASIQELSGDRLLLGVGAGWMAAEFTAVDVPRERRGAITNETLAFFHHCFDSEPAIANGQEFLFKPQPNRPPFLVGGSGAHVVKRIVEYGDGWLPMNSDPEKLQAPIAELGDALAAAGKGTPEVIPIASFDLDDSSASAARLTELSKVGVTGINYMAKYESVGEYETIVGKLMEVKSAAGIS
ncbi:MAG: LLM class flavin-dependent oxidoreductase [Pseudomonadota bacterium]